MIGKELDLAVLLPISDLVACNSRDSKLPASPRNLLPLQIPVHEPKPLVYLVKAPPWHSEPPPYPKNVTNIAGTADKLSLNICKLKHVSIRIRSTSSLKIKAYGGSIPN
jgi:hypothetical protein